MDFSKPKIMGILNVTPDSFSDGGKFFDPQNAIKRIHEMMQEGADIIDVGGESTRPGSVAVSLEEEMRRVKPIIDYIHKNNLSLKTDFSIDTYKAEVAEYAITRGFKIVNDVTSFRGDKKMIDVLLYHQPYLVLMYSKDAALRITKEEIKYSNILVTIKVFLAERIKILVDAGFPKNKIIIDPGTGAFISSDKKYSFDILEKLPQLKDLNPPILLGISRKLSSGDLEKRDATSVVLSKKAINNGASIIRIHNVKLMSEFLKQK